MQHSPLDCAHALLQLLKNVTYINETLIYKYKTVETA